MEKVIITIDESIEAMAEDWLWFREALSVGSQPPHVSARRLDALFEHLDETAFRHELEKAAELWPGNLLEVRFERVDEQAWQVSWRDNFKPLQVGTFSLVGEWVTQDHDPKTIRIYPGQAFGTGQHETTQLIIERMEHIDFKARRVLDVGCGTGILSIVAERLGAQDVRGFDVDPDAWENMERHLAINGTEHTTLSIGTLVSFPVSPFDVVLAYMSLRGAANASQGIY